MQNAARLRCLQRRQIVASIKPHYQSFKPSQTLTPPHHVFTRSISNRHEGPTLGQRMLEMTEQGRFVECLRLYDRVLSRSAELTEMAAYTVLRSTIARTPAQSGDTFLDLIDRCFELQTAAIFNLMFEAMAAEHEILAEGEVQLRSEKEYPTTNVAMLMELMDTHDIQPDFVTSFHLAHLSYQHSRTNNGDNYFRDFMQWRDEYLKHNDSTGYDGLPPCKIHRYTAYRSMFRVLIHLRKTEFAEYLLNMLVEAGHDRPWMLNRLQKLKNSEKMISELMNGKENQTWPNKPKPSRNDRQSQQQQPSQIVFNRKAGKTETARTETQLQIPSVLSIDQILGDRPSVDELLAAHQDAYQELQQSSPVDDYHNQLLQFNQHHDLTSAINQLKQGWSAGHSFQTAYYDLITIMLCTTPSEHSVRERIELIVQIIGQMASHHQELSLVPSMLALRVFAQFELPLPVPATKWSESDPLTPMALAQRCDALFYHCLSALPNDDPSIPLLRELYLRSQVKHPESGETAHQSIGLDSEDQSIVSSLTANSFVCLIYNQILAPRKGIRDAYHLFAALTSHLSQPPEAAFYYLSMGEIMRHNPSKARLIHLRAMQQNYITVSAFFHEAIVFALGHQDRPAGLTDALAEQQSGLLVDFDKTMSKRGTLNIPIETVGRIVDMGVELALRGTPVPRVDHLIDYCLSAMLQSDMQLQSVCKFITFALHSAHVSHHRTESLQQLVAQTLERFNSLDADMQRSSLVEVIDVQVRSEDLFNQLSASKNDSSDVKGDQSTSPAKSTVKTDVSPVASAVARRTVRKDNFMRVANSLPKESRGAFYQRCCEALLHRAMALSSVHCLARLPSELILTFTSPFVQHQIDFDPCLLSHLASYYLMIRSKSTPEFIEFALRVVDLHRAVHAKKFRSVDEQVLVALVPQQLDAKQLDSMEHQLRLMKLMYHCLILTNDEKVAMFGEATEIVPGDEEDDLLSNKSHVLTDEARANANLPVSQALEQFLSSMKASPTIDYDTLDLFVAWSASLQAVGWVRRSIELVDKSPVTLGDLDGGRLRFFKQLILITDDGRMHLLWRDIARSFDAFLPQVFALFPKAKDARAPKNLDDVRVQRLFMFHYRVFAGTARYFAMRGIRTPMTEMFTFPRCQLANGVLVPHGFLMKARTLITRIKVDLMRGSVTNVRAAIGDAASWRQIVSHSGIDRAHPSSSPCSPVLPYFPTAVELVKHIIESSSPISPEMTRLVLPDTYEKNPLLGEYLSQLPANSALRQAVLCIVDAFSHPAVLCDANLPLMTSMLADLVRGYHNEVRANITAQTQRASTIETQSSEPVADSDLVVLDEARLIELVVDAISHRLFQVVYAQSVMRASDREKYVLRHTATAYVPKQDVTAQAMLFDSLPEKRQQTLIDAAQRWWNWKRV